MKNSKENCPACNADLQGDPIDENIQHLYNATHASLKIYVKDPTPFGEDKYECPFCRHQWDVK